MKKILLLITLSLMLTSCLDHLLESDNDQPKEEINIWEIIRKGGEDKRKDVLKDNSVSNNKMNSGSEDKANNKKQNPNTTIKKSDYDTPLYGFTSERLLSVDELSKYNTMDLKIMRNEIFARHGYIFIKDSDMDIYFNQTNWYAERHRNVEDYLSNLEKKNIAIIQQAETMAEGINLNYKISVDNLRLRINPDVDSETIETLPENTIVEYLNEKSDFQTSVNIRGREITSHWYKVKTIYGNLGWIHGCCFEVSGK